MSDIVKTNGSAALTAYGSRDDVRELTDRIKAMLPGGQKLSDTEARSLAQISLVHQLDAFNGEAWCIPGAGVMVGIKGLRKHARKHASAENSVYWVEFRRADPAQYDQPEDAVIYECLLRDVATMQAWGKSVNIITSAGVPYQEAVKACGSAPIVIGVGIATPKERSRMEIHARARKRAEADAIKQRYDVHFEGLQFSPEEPETDLPMIDAKVEAPRKPNQILADLGYGGDTDVVEGEYADEPADMPLPEPVDEETELPDVPESEPPTLAKTFEMCRNMKTPKGTPLGSLTVEQLEIVAAGSRNKELAAAAEFILGYQKPESA